MRIPAVTQFTQEVAADVESENLDCEAQADYPVRIQ